MGSVSIIRIKNGFKNALLEAISLIGGLEKFVCRSDRVMLKPNLNGTEGITSLELCEALILILRDYGVKSIVIGESTFGNAQITETCFSKNGYRSLAQKYDIPLFNFNKSAVVRKPVAKPLVIDSLDIAKEVFDCDKIINLPVMKVHYATGVTLALKNLKGVLVGEQKRRFHEIGLDKAIVDLNNTLAADLNIVDATSCMEKMGPRGGDVFNLNLIVAGKNAGEVDYACAQIMDYSTDEVKHLKLYLEVNKIDLSCLKILGETIAQVKRPFKKVNLKAIVPENFRIHDKNACSACANALILSCQFLEEKPKENLDFYLGSKVSAEDLSDNFRIAFGNCCIYGIDADLKIKGCPPYPFDLKNMLGSRKEYFRGGQK